MIHLNNHILKKQHLKIFILSFMVLAAELFFTGMAVCDQTPDFSIVKGKWVRPDGGYIIHVNNIGPGGVVDADYFNPGKINVAQANVSEFKGLVKLFIRLQDKGYPGSTYTLYYYAQKNALAGFYYQPTIKKTFEVVFIRKTSE